MAGRVISAVLTLKDKDFSSGLKKAAGGTDDFQRRLKHTGNQVKRFKDDTVSHFSGLAKGVAAGIAGVFAIDKIKDFGVSLVESAATMQATKAQFTQVFGGVQDQAQKTVDNLGKSFGMASERIKPAYTQMTSMFKGLGLSTEDAMKQAESAVTLASDAAAFYDKSYEDANSALNSFIKGNYEGGEAIGLFANETQMASWASKNLGVDWKNLDEAGKQVARLQFAKAMQEAAGATGQAARESNSYQNQLGNLKSNWDTLKAKLGEKILEPAVNGIKSLSEWISKVDTQAIIEGFTYFGSSVKEYAVPAIEGIKTGISWIVDNKDTIIAATAGIVGGLIAFKIITAINTAIGFFNDLMAAYRAGTVMATLSQWGLNAALLASPWTWVAVGIGAVIAIGVLLWQNWDTVKVKAGELWDKTKEVFGNIKDWASEKIQPVVGFFSNLGEKFNSFKNAISNFKLPDWVTSIGSTIGRATKKLVNGSHASGLNNVPFDGYVAELHKGEMVIPSRQSEQLCKSGLTVDNIGKPSSVTTNNNTQTGGTTLIIQNLNTKGITATEVLNELIPQLKLALANM
jgi:hypothetical protein